MSTSRATWRRRSRSSSAALALVALLVAGCGGESARERYERAMQASLSVPLAATAPPTPLARRALAVQARALAAIEPPAEVAGEHARLVRELRALAAGSRVSVEPTLRAIEAHGYQVVATFQDAAD